VNQATSSSSAFFHVTHAKAGSTWLRRIFVSAFGSHLVAPRIGGNAQAFHHSEGLIHSALFLTYEHFRELDSVDTSRSFFVIRDPRDTLVSQYFSVRYSHEPSGHILKLRAIMEGMSDEEGMAYMLTRAMHPLMRIQLSWMRSGRPILKYEDLLEDAHILLPSILRQLDVAFSYEKLISAIDRNSFERVFGRKLGETDIQSHGRQGSPGEWKKYAVGANAQLFSGDLLNCARACGY
jgi:hypothetical protein